MPDWVPIPLDYEPWSSGDSDVFTAAADPIVAPLPIRASVSSARQRHFEDQLRRIAWLIGEDTIPIHLDFNGTRRRMDTGCLGHALANGVIAPPENGPTGYVERIVLSGLNTRTEIAPGGPELWHSYMREQIPALFGLPFIVGKWQQTGFVVEGTLAFLLVTLDKTEFVSDHQYDDAFLDDRRFRWQSQNRTKQGSQHGRIISQQDDGTELHLFVRKQGKAGGKATPFTYFGELQFVSWDGEQPITVEFALRDPVPSNLLPAFAVAKS